MDITARVRQVFDQNIKSFGGRMTYRAPGAPLRVYILQPSFFHLVGTQVQDVTLLMEDVTEQIRLGEEVVKTQRHLASIVESAET
jgi:hypothetical protein